MAIFTKRFADADEYEEWLEQGQWTGQRPFD